MYGREQRVLLRHYLEQGLSKTEIARQLGVSLRTLYYWIDTGQLDRSRDNESLRYRCRPQVPHKIDKFRGIITARLAEYPRLTAMRLFEEICAAGYKGGYSQVKEFVRQIRPGAVPEPVVRFEAPPGRQAQVDFAEFRLPWGKRYALFVVLSYSRRMWLQFYPRQSMEVLMQGLEEAFAFHGGVPLELLFDQMKAVVVDDQRGAGGRVLENVEFSRFARHWGFRIRACRPYRAQTKGKVERPIRYVRQSFFYGREFLNDADLNTQALSWVMRKANQRKHRTTAEAPDARFLRDELALLQPLARAPYRGLATLSDRPTCRIPAAALPRVERRSLSEYGRLAGDQR
ncbi:hypothetical protein BSFA1_87270 (plasmid) [Burkholderia sp. SFA1]|nr:hypothetical protein BSFA1_87270 [Burkholderia sp. SFA1]